MHRKLGTWFVFIGALAMLAALGLLIYDAQISYRAEENATAVLSYMDVSIEEAQESGRNTGTPADGDAQDVDTSESVSADASSEDIFGGETPVGMDTVLIDGRQYIGKISIPRFGLELPVLSEWSYPGLRIAPGRYAGSVWTDDLVICGHNYDRHFGRLRNLRPGDTVIFTDANGNVFTYAVQEVTILQPTAIEEMITGDWWDLTLFTCTLGGRTRVTVRCGRVESDE